MQKTKTEDTFVRKITTGRFAPLMWALCGILLTLFVVGTLGASSAEAPLAPPPMEPVEMPALMPASEPGPVSPPLVLVAGVGTPTGMRLLTYPEIDLEAQGAEDLLEGLREQVYGVRMEEVRQMMQILARGEHYSLDTLVRKHWKTDPDLLVRIILEEADRHDLDPLLLVALAWKESRFNPKARGDKKGEVRVSCGWTQVRTDFKDRPTCEKLMNPRVAMAWTAKRLARTKKLCGGEVCLAYYNGGRYESKVWRLADRVRRAL